MQIICNDGTTIQCRDFEAIDSGVLFFQETRTRREGGEDEEEDEEERESADGFVPVTQLRFVLPDEMVQGPGAQPAATQQRTTGAPPGATGGGMAQQQMQQFQGPPGGRGPESGTR